LSPKKRKRCPKQNKYKTYLDTEASLSPKGHARTALKDRHLHGHKGIFCTNIRIFIYRFQKNTANRFEHQYPVPPGVREPDKQLNVPVETPAMVKRKPEDLARLRAVAEELAKLSAAISSQIQQLNHGGSLRIWTSD
jgi:hypothetical protein